MQATDRLRRYFDFSIARYTICFFFLIVRVLLFKHSIAATSSLISSKHPEVQRFRHTHSLCRM